MGAYHNLSEKLQQRIIEDRKEHRANPYAFSEEQVLRREMNHDRANLWRPPFVRDIEKIMHDRSNGLGGGFAGYGIYPEYAEQYAFHVFTAVYCSGNTECGNSD